MNIHNDWPTALLAINELLRTHAPLFDHDSIWKRVREATKAEDDHQRHLAIEVILKECLLSVSEYTERQKNKREGYDLSLAHFADRYAGLYPLLDDALAGVRYVSFYNISRECYSPAEGGCWFDRHTLVATLPLSAVLHLTDYYQVVALADPRGEVKRLATLLAESYGLTYDTILLETFPAQYQTLRTPTYE